MFKFKTKKSDEVKTSPLTKNSNAVAKATMFFAILIATMFCITVMLIVHYARNICGNIKKIFKFLSVQLYMDVYRVNIILWAIYVFATVCLFTISVIQKYKALKVGLKLTKALLGALRVERN